MGVLATSTIKKGKKMRCAVSLAVHHLVHALFAKRVSTNSVHVMCISKIARYLSFCNFFKTKKTRPGGERPPHWY